MQCCFEGHQNKPIEGFCVNSECNHYPFFCRRCYRELHIKHLKECIMFDEGPELLQNLLQNQESLKNGLTGLLKTIQTKSGVLIQNLERNIKIIKDLNDILKEQRLDDIKKNVALIKHYYSFQVQTNSGYGTKIGKKKMVYLENVIHDFQKMQEELEGQIKMLSNPAVLYISKGLELLNDQQFEKAILQLEKAIHLDCLSIDALVLKGIIYFQFIAKALRKIKVYEQAQCTIDQALRINKNNFKALLELGYLLKDQTIFQEALPQFEECLKLDSNNVDALLGKADCLLALKEYKDASILYEQVLKQDGGNYDALIGNGLALEQIREPDKAQISFEKATIVDPQNEKGFYYRGLILKKVVYSRIHYDRLQDPQNTFEGLLECTLKCFNTVLNLNPNNIQARIECAELKITVHECLQNKPFINQAIKELQQIIEKNPSNQEAYYLMGRALEGNQQTVEAIKHYNIGLQLDQNHEKMKNAKLKAEIKITEIQITTLIQQNKCKEATQMLSTSSVSEEQKINIYGQLGQQLINNRQFLETFDILGKQLTIIKYLGNKNLQYHKWVEDIRFKYAQLSLDFLKLRQFEKAIECFDITVELPNKSYLAFHNIKGDCLFQMFKYSEALVAYEEMLKGNKITKIQYYQKIGIVLLKQQKYQQAIENLDKNIELSEDFINENNAKIRRGVKYNPQHNKITGDDDVYQPADLQRFLNLSMAYECKSRALFYQNKFRESLVMINEAISINSEAADSYYFRSQILAKLDYQEESEKSLVLAKQKGLPNGPPVFLFEFDELQMQALTLIQEQKYEEAIKNYEKMIIIQPYQTQLYVYLGQLLLLCKKRRKCLKLIDQAINMNPKSQTIYEFQILQLQTLIIDFISEKQYSKALTPLIKGLSVDRNILLQFCKDQNLLEKIGIGLLNESIYNKAIESLDQQLLIYEELKDKNYKNALYYKCLSLYRLQQYDQVMINIDQLITQYDCKSQVFGLLGDTLFKQQKYDESIIAYQEALTKELNYNFYINIGDSLVQKQQYKEAIGQYDLLLANELQIDQNLQNIALIHKAQVLIIQEQYQEAILLLKQIVENDPQYSLAYYHLSKTLQKLGITNEAQHALEQAQQHGLEINDQKESMLMTVTALISDKSVPVSVF